MGSFSSRGMNIWWEDGREERTGRNAGKLGLVAANRGSFQ